MSINFWIFCAMTGFFKWLWIKQKIKFTSKRVVINHSCRDEAKPNLLAKCLRVLLHLFEDHAHGGVAYNLLHLKVIHGPPLHLLWTVIPGILTDHTALNSFSGFLKAAGRKKKKTTVNPQKQVPVTRLQPEVIVPAQCQTKATDSNNCV